MILLLIILLPLAAAILSFWPSHRRSIPGVVTVGATGASVVLALDVAARCASGVIMTGLSGALWCDAFGALVLVVCAFAGFTAALFSIGFTRRATHPMESLRVRRYFVRLDVFLASVLVVPVLANVAFVWIAVALTTLLSVFLVSFNRNAPALEAAWKYAVLTSMGAALALFGVLLLHWSMRAGGGHTFTWAGLNAVAKTLPLTLVKVSFLFMLVGYGTKAALVPFHAWLPDVYSQAPAAVGALLSVLETTVLPYVLLRMLPLFPGASVRWAGSWLMVFGLLSAGGAALLLIQVKDLKRLFAYSTIENAGIILAAAGMGGAAGYGAMYQLMAHALAKPFGFFAAGTAIFFLGTGQLKAMQGLGRRSPWAGAALLAGGLAVTGAPPFALFLSELSILAGGAAAHRLVPVALLTLFMVMAFSAVLYHIVRIVFGEPTGEGPVPSFPKTFALTLAISLAPVLVLGMSLPAGVQQLMRLAAATLGR